MPPTGRRRTRNKEPEQRPDAGPDMPETNTTPSRKRRRMNGSEKANTNAAPPKRRRSSAESDATVENGEGAEQDMEGAAEYQEAEAIIQRLRTAHYQVGVSLDHHNSIVPQNEQAFAKIAGRSWTYYVKDTSVIIGRPNAKAKRESGEGLSTPAKEDNSMQINIDLGPDQQVSRMHAEIVYAPEEQEWVIYCNGRNGLTVNDSRVEKGQNCVLHSGSVVNIVGTQMLFILPNQVPVIHEAIKRMLLADAEEDEGNPPEDKSAHGTNRRLGTRVSNGHTANATSKPAPPSGTQAAHALAALSSSQNVPGTPLLRNQPPQPKSKNSPAYSRGLMLESTEDIDYGAESAKDIKPPHSYAQMIGQAILSREEENATLAQIYEFIKERYAFFRYGGGGWQNSIRHNLSLSKHFEKIPRRTDEPGKGMKWQIVPEFREEYMKKNFHDSRKVPTRRVESSSPNSPAIGLGPGAQTERLVGALQESAKITRGSRSMTPPHGYPAQTESYTPDRGPSSIRVHSHQPPTSVGAAPRSATSEFLTPTFDRTGSATQQTYSAGSHPRDGLTGIAAGSPPALAGSAYDPTGNPSIFTPLPERQALKPHMFSTVKPPSFYAKDLFSSPAPFWKFSGFPASTPMRPLIDPSPEKLMKQEPASDDIRSDIKEASRSDEKKEAKTDNDDDEEPEVPPPSSPLGAKHAAEAAEGSLSRTVSRPGSRHKPASAPVVASAAGSNHVVSNGVNITNGLDNIPKLAPPPAQPKFDIGAAALRDGPNFKLYSRGAEQEADDEDDEGIDLTNNFQKIGQFHRAMQVPRVAR